MELAEQLVDAWRINARLALYLLEAVPDGALATKVQKSKSVAGHLGHTHNVRLMWLKAAAPDLHEGLSKVEGDGDREALAAALTASGEAIAILLVRGIAEGRVKGFKPHPAAFLGYLVAHEAFHRAQAELALRQAGLPLDDRVAYGLWEWGVR
ncbi:MAG: hypothetical protein KIS66_12930 [Fimbriimonadaceae bacterium]|nr:hypothetical protein [Fimbriimonadaceae bacterium]